MTEWQPIETWAGRAKRYGMLLVVAALLGNALLGFLGWPNIDTLLRPSPASHQRMEVRCG